MSSYVNIIFILYKLNKPVYLLLFSQLKIKRLMYIHLGEILLELGTNTIPFDVHLSDLFVQCETSIEKNVDKTIISLIRAC